MDALRDTCVSAASEADTSADVLQDCLDSMTSGAAAAVDRTIGVAARLYAATDESVRADVQARQRTIVKHVEHALEECETNADLLRAAARVGPGPLGVDGLLHVVLPGSYVAACPCAAVAEEALPCFLLVPDGECDARVLCAYGTRGEFTYYTKSVPVFAQYVTVKALDLPVGADFVARVSNVPDGLRIAYDINGWTFGTPLRIDVIYVETLLCSTSASVFSPPIGVAAMLQYLPAAMCRSLETIFSEEKRYQICAHVRANLKQSYFSIQPFSWEESQLKLALRTLRDPIVVRLLLDILDQGDLVIRGVELCDMRLSSFSEMPEYADAKRRFGF